MGLEEPYNSVTQSILITKYSGVSITNNKTVEASVMNMQQETAYMSFFFRKFEGKKELGRPSMGRRITLKRIFKK